MARISNKPVATSADIDNNDYLLGNDLNGSSVVTKTFTIEDLKSFILEGVETGSSASPTYVSNVNTEGNALEQSPIHVTTVSNVDFTQNPLTLNDQNITITVLGNGQVQLLFSDPDSQWVISGLVGGSFRAYQSTAPTDAETGLVTGDPIWTGSIVSVDPFSVDSEGNTIVAVNVTLDSNILAPTTTLDLGLNPITGNQIELFGTFDSRGIQIDGTTLITGDLTVEGSSRLGDRLDIGNSLTQSADVHIHGNLSFDEPGDAIVFGDGEDPDVMFSSTGDNLNIGGSGAINFSSTNPINVDGPSTFGNNIIVDTDTSTNSTITVTDNELINTTIISPTGVTINGVSISDSVSGSFAPNTGSGTQVLQTVTFGDVTYSIPSPTGSAGVLPGVTVELGDAETVFTIGSFFSGTVDVDPATGEVTVSFGAVVTLAGSYDTVADSNVIDLSADGNAAADIAILDTAFTSGPLFFKEDSGGSIAGDVYQITEVATDGGSEAVTFGLVGGGGFTISTDATTINSDSVFFTGIGERPSGGTRFLFADDSTGAVSYGDLGEAVGFNELTYEVAGGQATSGIESLDFQGAHNIDTNDANNPIIDLTGRFASGGEMDQSTSDTQLASWRLYVLNPLDTQDKSVQLPLTPEIGDSVKIVNLSTVDATALTETTSSNIGNEVTSFQWSIQANGTSEERQRIMRQKTDLVLDDPTASFELYYTGGTAGWVITSIN